MHLIGGAGEGKTHALAQLCSSADGSGLFLRGISFSRVGTIQSQILQLLDLKVSWSDFCSALSIYAASYNKLVVLAIDALNEAENVALWKNELQGLQRDLTNYSGIAFVTSCRPSYVEAIWGTQTRLVPLLFVSGFNSFEVKQAITRYFEYYRISGTVTLATLEEFKHPLYLSIFCQATNRDRINIRHVFLGQQSLFTVFGRYIDAANVTFSERLDRPQSARMLHDLLRRFAKKLWEKKSRRLSQHETRTLLDGGENVPWSTSATKALLEEELILSRSYLEDSEGYEFAYDALAGYLIAEEALRSLPADFEHLPSRSAASALEPVLDVLVNADYGARHPLYEDILRALAAVLPARTGKQLLYLTSNDEAFGAAVSALFEMDSQYISAREVQELERLFLLRRNQNAFFHLFRNTAFVPGHPLNSAFLSRLLSVLSMADRDLAWSEFLRSERKAMADVLKDFIEMLAKQISTVEGKQQLRLAAVFAQWMLTATNRFLRDSATRALVIFGTRFPQALFNITEDSLAHNDPYVPERMLAASYGAAMRLHCRPSAETFRHELLPRFAYRVYAAMFSESAPFATTHSLMRDYAKNIIALALLHTPSALTDAEKQNMKPPFRGGIRNWRRRPDYDHNKYRDGNSPLGSDWKNYTLGALAAGRKTYDYEHPSFIEVNERVLWRIHDLGYSLDRFGEIDKDIARIGWQPQPSTNITDRYGEKNAWIAFYELYGFMEDEGTLPKKEYQDPSPHPDQADIDPSFPGRPHALGILKHDILGLSESDGGKWVAVGPDPNFGAYLKSNIVASQTGPWFLLEASFLRRSDQHSRNGFTFIRAFCVANSKFKEFQKLLRSESPGHWLRDIPEVRGFFAGEFPWQAEIPTSSTDVFRVQVGTRKVANPPPQTVIVHFGDESFELPSYPMPAWRDEPIERQLTVEVPVQEIPFDSKSPLHRSGGSVLAKQICQNFGLWLALPSWDMFDPAGNRVVISTRKGKFSNSDAAIYGSVAMIERHLIEQHHRLVWIVFGERQMLTRSGENAGYKQFKQLYNLDNGRIFKL